MAIAISSLTGSPQQNPLLPSLRTWPSNNAASRWLRSIGFEEAMRSLHLLGRQGVTLIATAALDMAMWDALAKALGLPLVVMLGGTVGPVRAYNTNGLWLIPLERLADEASSLVAEGDFKALKIRLGRDNVKDDVEAIAEVRRAVGDDIILMSDFNQGLSFLSLIHI